MRIINMFIMGIAMVAMLAFGGTFAYFTATATGASGSITTGTVKLTNASALTISGNKLVPGQSIATVQGVTFSNASTVETVVAVKYTVTYSGGYFVAGAEGWGTEQQTTDGAPLTLTNAEINAIFGTSPFQPTSNWADNNNNIFIYKTTEDNAVYSLAGITASATDVAFITNETALTLAGNRLYDEGVLSKPANPTSGDRYLTLEGATITISMEAYQTQLVDVTSVGNFLTGTEVPVDSYADAYAILAQVFGTTTFPALT